MGVSAVGETGEYVALEQSDEHLWHVCFSSHPLGILNENKRKITTY